MIWIQYCCNKLKKLEMNPALLNEPSSIPAAVDERGVI